MRGISFNVLALEGRSDRNVGRGFSGYQAPIKQNEAAYIFDFT
jgi:hypothetical protein